MQNNISEDLQLKIKILLEKISFLCAKYLITSYDNYADMKVREDDYNNCHKEALQLVSSIIKDSKDSLLFAENYKHFKRKNILEDFPFKIADCYILYFNKHYFNILNGNYNIQDNHIIKDIDDIEEHKHKINSMNADLMYPILITPSGECFFGPNGHEILCKWLYLKDKKDLKSSLRVDVDFKNKNFEFSSIYGYTEDDKNEELISLTNEQANALSKLYSSMINMYGEFNPLYQNALYSSGLGLGSHEKQSETSQHNLNKLKKYFGKDFNLQLYNRCKNNLIIHL